MQKCLHVYVNKIHVDTYTSMHANVENLYVGMYVMYVCSVM